MPIKTVLETENVPVKAWADISSAEWEKTAAQLKNTALLPFVFKHVAAMPDVHFGMGATIGSVIATKGAICPAAVGVDIGCGMMAVKTALDARRIMDKAPEVRHSIERAIPLGREANRNMTVTVEGWDGWGAMTDRVKSCGSRAKEQLGSLGGGNHFIELCTDQDGALWVMLHSGSRNVGKSVADFHVNEAKGLMKRFFINLPDPDLAYLAEGTPQFKAYIEDLRWCQDYAAQNRREMMHRVLEQIGYAMTGEYPNGDLIPSMSVECHHNYVAWENHFGENVMVTRKGAVRAREGDMGIIPGSMGTGSFIVRGRGNADSFHSCSHGAGRKMSRMEARRRFTAEDLAAQTAGVECRKDVDVVDEIPGAYKDINQVMADQSDLVEVVAQLKQFVCIKG